MTRKAYLEGQAEERGRIIAWLREQHEGQAYSLRSPRYHYKGAAASIEEGRHWEAPEPDSCTRCANTGQVCQRCGDACLAETQTSLPGCGEGLITCPDCAGRTIKSLTPGAISK